MGIKATISSIRTPSLEAIELKRGDIVVFVGPNNVGKSRALQDIKEATCEQVPEQLAVQAGALRIDSTVAEVTKLASPYYQNGRYGFPTHGYGGIITEQLLKTTPYVFRDFFVTDLSTRLRLQDCDPQPSVDTTIVSTLMHPFHWMSLSRDIELQVSNLFCAAFQEDLIIWPGGGSTASAFIGTRPVLSDSEWERSDTYLERLKMLPKLESQGDGVRSYASIIGRLVTEDRPFLLIDEPEAFLHPPQARKIGAAIGAHSEDRQTFVSTHSQDVLRGVISTASERVHIIRLARKAQKRVAHHISSTNIKQLWDDPILRYSNVLDGLFHDAVIVGEADYDCRFYQALIEASTADNRPDFLYVHVNGKSRMHLVVNALTQIGVPVVSIFDFDILNAEQPLRKTIEAAGGAWTDFYDEWKFVADQVSGKTMREPSTVVGKRVKDKFASFGATDFGYEQARAIESLIRVSQPWDIVRTAGLSALTAYDCYDQGVRLLERLRTIGIFVVPEGEMEQFDRGERARKGKWVNAVLEGDLMAKRLEGARQFVRDIVKWVTTPAKDDADPALEAGAEAPTKEALETAGE